VRARDLVIDFPTVRADDDALTATRLLAERHLPGLVVLDGGGRPFTVLPASQVLRFMIPRYVQDDPALARVVDESYADRMCAALADRRVAELLPRNLPPLPVVGEDDTALEIAAMMAERHSPLVAVLAGDAAGGGPLLGVVTAGRLLERLLAL
jgi:CBS domain-containing protein